MKVKIVGFKVGVARPTYNKTLHMIWSEEDGLASQIYGLGYEIARALQKSDFLSIRKIDHSPNLDTKQ